MIKEYNFFFTDAEAEDNQRQANEANQKEKGDEVECAILSCLRQLFHDTSPPPVLVP